jgi:protein TonB
MTSVPYRLKKAQKAAAKRQLRIARGGVPGAVAAPQLPFADPLLEKKERFIAGKLLAIIIGAGIAHVVALFIIYGAAEVFARLGLNITHVERLEVAVIDKPKEPEKKVEEPPKEEKPPEPEPPKKKKKPPPPPPDPIDVPEPPKEEPPPEVEQPQEVVGLSADSAVTEGEGPSFAVGNTRMGETDKIAKDPNAIEELKKTGVKPPPRQPTVIAAKRLRQVKPLYPSRYEQMGYEGTVTVRVTIDEEGNPIEVEVTQPSPHPEFNLAAKKAALREKFAPATRDGKPIKTTLTYIIHFRLEG